MKNCILIIAIAILLNACGHGITPNFPQDREMTSSAEIIIIRNKNLICAGQSTTVFLDGLDIAQLRIGEYVSVPVGAGMHYLKAVPFLGSGRAFHGIFEQGEKYYLLISLLEPWDYEGDITDILLFPNSSRPGCDFEIENIGEEKGLKRVKNSTNLLEKLKAHESTAGNESKKIAYSFNPTEPWTGLWDVWGDLNWSGLWAMKQTDHMVVYTEKSAIKFEGLVAGDKLIGKIKSPQKTYPFTIRISPDGQSFEGTSTDFLGRSTSIKGTRRK